MYKCFIVCMYIYVCVHVYVLSSNRHEEVVSNHESAGNLTWVLCRSKYS